MHLEMVCWRLDLYVSFRFFFVHCFVPIYFYSVPVWSFYVNFALVFVVHVLINADTGGVLAIEQNIICCEFLS